MAAAGTPWQMQQASDIASKVGYQDPTAQMTAEDVTSYMNPYQQSVVDIEKREAQRQADVAESRLGLQAAGAGGLGGYREGIEQAELARNAAQLQADIQTRGSQRGYDMARHVDSTVHMFDKWGLPMMYNKETGRYQREGKWQIMIHGESYKPIVAEAAKKSADKIYNRIMITHLLMDENDENRIGGAVGFNMRTGDYYVCLLYTSDAADE